MIGIKTPLKLALTVAMSAVVLAGCGLTATKDAIFTVNKTVVTKQQFQKELDKAAQSSMFNQMGVDIRKDPSSFMYLMVKDRIVNDLIVKTLLDEEIKKHKIKVTDKDVDAELKTIIERIGSKERFDEVIKQNGVTIAQVKKDIKQELKVRKLLDTMQPTNVSDAQIAKFYKENKENFRVPERVRASHILVSANTDEIKEAILAADSAKKMTEKELQAKVDLELVKKLAIAKEIQAQVAKDSSQFAKIAKEKSEDTMSGKQGGDLGFFTFKDMVEPFSKAAFAMKPNTVSGVVKTVYGYHIIMVTDRAKAGVEPLDKVKADIKTFLENQEKFAAFQKYVEKLRKEAQITYNDPSFNPVEIQAQMKKMNEEAQTQRKELEKQAKAKK